jgi:hypothetical protein
MRCFSQGGAGPAESGSAEGTGVVRDEQHQERTGELVVSALLRVDQHQ